jgi:DNA-directed RNA polymerase subunit F
MYEHVERFSKYKTEASARESRACVKHLDVAEIHQVVLCDLLPASAEEAKSLLRILERLPDEELERVLADLANCSSVTSDV